MARYYAKRNKALLQRGLDRIKGHIRRLKQLGDFPDKRYIKSPWGYWVATGRPYSHETKIPVISRTEMGKRTLRRP